MYYLTHGWKDKGVHTFPKGICSKVNVIARLVFELANYDSAVHRFNHYTMRTLKSKRLVIERAKDIQSTIFGFLNLESENKIILTTIFLITQTLLIILNHTQILLTHSVKFCKFKPFFSSALITVPVLLIDHCPSIFLLK